MAGPAVGRRQLLSGMAGAAVLAGAPALAACTPTGGGPTAPADGGRSAVTMPAYVPFDKIPTDHPATESGGLAAYLGIPRPPYDAITEVPGSLVGRGRVPSRALARGKGPEWAPRTPELPAPDLRPQ